ncbi:MAG: mechanosensitive ion channel family protein [Bacteroidia bacterium]|jgi:small-conductance mechanosensitive channel|nr:mechanosensitive ion channel family protein [Bacteroidia bacterium]
MLSLINPDYLHAAYLILGFFAGLALGYILERIVLNRLHVYAMRTAWKYDDIFIQAMKGLVRFWLALISFTIVAHSLPLGAKFYAVSHKVVFSVSVISITVAIGRIAVGLFKSKDHQTDGLLPSTSIIANITRVLIFLVGILVILQTLGISVTPVLTALGVGGLAVALALQDTLTNLFSGIQVIASRQIRIGDFIRLDSGEEGRITDITWRNTTILALANNVIIIPNSKLASAIIRNFSLHETEVALYLEVGVAYDSDLEKVERVTLDTAKQTLINTEGAVSGFEPLLRFHTFGDSSINLTVMMRVKEFVYQYPVKHAFIKALHKAYLANGIEIPFPIRTLIHKTPHTQDPASK